MIDKLIEAAREGNTAIVEKLLLDDPDLLYAMKDTGETPLMTAIYHGKHHVVQLLLNLQAPISLHEAAALGELETLQYLVEEENVPVDDMSYDGWTALHLTAFFGHVDVAKYLIEQGAHVNIRSSNPSSVTPLHSAVTGRKQALVMLLLEHGADPNIQEAKGKTPLHQAVEQYDVHMVDILLRHGADPMIMDESQKTPVDLAKENEFDDIEQRLLKAMR